MVWNWMEAYEAWIDMIWLFLGYPRVNSPLFALCWGKPPSRSSLVSSHHPGLPGAHRFGVMSRWSSQLLGVVPRDMMRADMFRFRGIPGFSKAFTFPTVYWGKTTQLMCWYMTIFSDGSTVNHQLITVVFSTTIFVGGFCGLFSEANQLMDGP